MAEKKYLDLLGLQIYDGKIKEHISAADAEVLAAAKAHAESLADNYDAAGTATTKVKELADGAVAGNTAAIEKLNGSATTEGSVAKAVADAKGELNAAIAENKAAIESNDSDISGLTGRMDAVEGKAGNNADEIGGLKTRMDAAEGDIDAIEADMGNVDNLSTTNKTVVAAINEVLNAVGTGGTAAAVTMDTSVTTDGALKSYTLKQGGVTVGTIDIPKDMVVESGSVVDLAAGEVEGLAAGKYIKLVLANVEEPLYIAVASLVDIYVAKQEAAQVQIAIDSSTREISASIVAESVTATELAANAVTTAKIADANVTKAKLSTEVQASLAKADVAEANAKAYADELNTAMDERMDVVEAALGAGEGSVEDKINAAKTELRGEISSAVEGAKTDASNKDAVVLAEAQKGIDAVQANLDTHTGNADIHVTAEDKAKWDAASGKAHEHGNKDVLDGITAAKVEAWDAAEGNAKGYADGLNTAMNTRVAALEEWHENFTEVTEAEINALFA